MTTILQWTETITRYMYFMGLGALIFRANQTVFLIGVFFGGVGMAINIYLQRLNPGSAQSIQELARPYLKFIAASAGGYLAANFGQVLVYKMATSGVPSEVEYALTPTMLALNKSVEPSVIGPIALAGFIVSYFLASNLIKRGKKGSTSILAATAAGGAAGAIVSFFV